MLRRSSIITIAALVLASAAPASAASWHDLRSPGAREAARSGDLSRVLGHPEHRGRAGLKPVSRHSVATGDSGSGGFDWDDAAAGAAGTLGLLGVSAGLTFLITSLRRRRLEVANR